MCVFARGGSVGVCGWEVEGWEVVGVDSEVVFWHPCDQICLGKFDGVSAKLCPGEAAQQEAECTRQSNRAVDQTNKNNRTYQSSCVTVAIPQHKYLLRPRFDRSKYSTASGDPTQRERSTWRKQQQNQPFVQMSSKTVSYGVQWRYTLYVNLLGCSVSCFSHRKLPRFVLSYLLLLQFFLTAMVAVRSPPASFLPQNRHSSQETKPACGKKSTTPFKTFFSQLCTHDR